MLKEYSYLSDAEDQLISQFVENRPMLEAVRKVLLSGIYQDGVMEAGKPEDMLKNFVLGKFTQPIWSNAPMSEKGMALTAIVEAISMLHSGFEILEKFKKPLLAEKPKNKVKR